MPNDAFVNSSFASEKHDPSFAHAVFEGLGKPTVFLVDPDRTTQAQVRDVANTMQVAWEGYRSGRAFVDHYSHDRSGCVVLEVRLPTISGLEIQEFLAHKTPSPAVVFLTAHGTISLAVRALHAGAVQFLEKPASGNELWEAIRSGLKADLVRRQTWLQRSAVEELLETLTTNERRILTMLAEGETKRSMANELAASIRTVEIYQARLRNKLGLTKTAQLVHFSVVADLVLRPSFPAIRRFHLAAPTSLARLAMRTAPSHPSLDPEVAHVTSRMRQ